MSRAPRFIRQSRHRSAPEPQDPGAHAPGPGPERRAGTPGHESAGPESPAPDPLVAVLDTLLPGEGEWPSAGALGLAARVREGAELVPGGAEGVAAVLAALPPEFTALPPEGRAGALAAQEAATPEPFERLVSEAYTAYYTDARVRAVLASLADYADRPPQPEGHALPPFDPARLSAVAARAPFWRGQE